MPQSFDSATRALIQGRCAAFARRPPEGMSGDLKRAAVAIALVESDLAPGRAGFLLTLRAASLRAHSNQFALPGGRCDPDETAIDAALREMHEELGVAVGREDVLGLLDDYPTRSGYLITPVVVWAHDSRNIVPNPQEVAAVFRIGLDQIAHDVFDFVRIPESERRVIRFRYDGDYIHAPTAALIYQFREIMAGRDTRVADLEQPVFAWK